MDYRQEFSDFGQTLYLDCAHQGPFPRRAVARIQEAIELKCHPERLDEREYAELPKRVAAQFAALVGARGSEIALASSTSHGMATVANALGLATDDEVVVASSNLQSNLAAWLRLQRAGVKVFPINTAVGGLRTLDVSRCFTAHTRVLVADWVDSSSGARSDLATLGELAHRRGAMFVVDGREGVGALELHLHDLPVDALVTAGWKWLLGPFGTAFVYMNWKVQDLLNLRVEDDSGAWEALNPGAPTDELPMSPSGMPLLDLPSSGSFLNLYSLEGSLEFVERAGVATVTQHCTRLLERLAQGLYRRGYWLSAATEPERRSTILSFYADSPESTTRLHEMLAANHVVVSLRQGMIRVSPYLYNDEADIDRLLDLVGENPRAGVASPAPRADA